MAPIAEFVSGLDGIERLARRPLPFSLEVDSMAGTRVADVVLLLGLITAFWGIGKLLRGSGKPQVSPAVLASALTGVLLLFFTNPAFYMVGGVRVDESGITLETHLGADEVLAWSDLKAVGFEPGELFPAFTDDASLVLVGPDDQTLEVPRFIPGVEAVAAEVAHRTDPTSNLDQRL